MAPMPCLPGARWVRVLGSLLVAVAALGAAPSASAFCRTRTCEFRPDLDCEVDLATGCSTVGEFVFWSSSCIPYAVQRDGSTDEDISASELEALMAEGFQTWSDVRCAGGGTPVLASGSQGTIACDQVEYDCNLPERNSNLVVFRDEFANGSSGLRFGVIALTTLTANLVSGELFDADIEINSRDEDFEIGGGGVGANPNEPRDLRGVINHELGHLLGLSHTLQRGALMRAAYEGTFVPAADDAAAMCEALGSDASDPACSVVALDEDAQCVGSDTTCTSQRDVDLERPGCACEVGGASGSGRGSGVAVAFAALALALRLGRRRAGAPSR